MARHILATVLLAASATACASVPTSPSAKSVSPTGPSLSAPAPVPATTEEARATEEAPSLTPIPIVGAAMTIEYTIRKGITIPLRLADPSSSGATIRIASPAELKLGEAALGDGDTSVVAIDERLLLLTWVGTICETGYTLGLSIGLGGVVITGDARPGCDTGRVVFAVALTMPRAVDPHAFAIELRPPFLVGG